MPNTTNENHYDLIVVGSGMGSLATASLMASMGKQRVLVLEGGRKLGGFLHTFRRGEYQWEPGVHYVSGMGDGMLNRRCMDLITGGKTQWHKIGEPLENVFFPEGTFQIHSDPKLFQRDLIARFPAEEAGIKRYFKDMKHLQEWSHRWYVSKQFSGRLAAAVSAGRKLAERNTKEYLDEVFDDELLKAIVTSQWPDFGTPPHESALAFHGIVATAFFDGGFYPIGGPDSIIRAAVEQIESRGGTCLRNHRVDEILIEDNKAFGVRVTTRKGTEEFFAPRIVSGAGVRNTFENMVPEPWAKSERQRAAGVTPGTSSLVLFLGLNDDPAKRGFEEGNYWMFRNTSHVPSVTPAGELPVIDGAYLGFGGPMRDPKAKSQVAQIISFSNDSSWADFADGAWKQRGEEYESHKDKVAELLLDFVEEYVPGLRDIVAFKELSTPLTISSFLDHPGGQVYGHACDIKRVRDNAFRVETSVENLYLTGTDLANPGIDSAMMIGVMAASHLLGWTGMMRIMTKAYTAKYDDVDRSSVEADGVDEDSAIADAAAKAATG